MDGGRGRANLLFSLLLFFLLPQLPQLGLYKLQLVVLIKACYYYKTCFRKCELGTEAESRTVNAVIGRESAAERASRG